MSAPKLDKVLMLRSRDLENQNITLDSFCVVSPLKNKIPKNPNYFNHTVGLVPTDKDNLKLVPYLAHGVNSILKLTAAMRITIQNQENQTNSKTKRTRQIYWFPGKIGHIFK